MASIAGGSAIGRRQGRRWQFASAVLDEASWTLSVDGKRVALEAKPMELLHALLLRAGEVVTKDELLDAVWPGISVVEASLPTAMLKLRRALGDEERGSRIIETVPRIGYRLAVPVVTVPQPDAATTSAEIPADDRDLRSVFRWPIVAGGLAMALTAGALAYAAMPRTSAASASSFTQRDVADAIRTLDVERINAMLRAGWDPNTPFDDQGNGAMTFVLNVCEWNPGHDQARLLLMARTLVDAGVRIDLHNKWGDTPYSIAKARRYCGPDHPVTKMMHALCYSSPDAPGDKCLATYETKKP